MWKQIRKIIFKLTVLLTPFLIGIMFVFKLFPMKFYDDEYAWYLQNQEFALSHDGYYRILIMGDSAAKSSWLPELLSDDTYNFALGGASPLEEYYYLRDYLQHNSAPQYVIYTTRSEHLLSCSTFWSRSVYFHRFQQNDLDKLISEMDHPQAYSSLLGDDIQKEYNKYKYYSPSKYSSAFVHGLFSFSRYKTNMEKYQSVISSRGQTQFGTSDYCDKLYTDASYQAFEVNGILDQYLRKIIDLCEENNITFVFQNAPYNQSTYEALQANFVNDYTNYLTKLAADYPYLSIDTEIFYYENNYFGDASHLNKQGTEKFSLEMKKKYHNVFSKN